jgi:ribosomal-protein-alanine N-acetyltransferase
MGVTLQEYDPADFETLYAIDRACYPPGISYSRRTLRWFLALPGASCLVARIGARDTAEIAGFIIAESEGSEAHIITIDVAETHRRSGVGTALLDEMERRLAAGGARRVALETATSNEAAIAFWQRHGYLSRGVLRRYYLGRLDAFAMWKELAPPGRPQPK